MNDTIRRDTEPKEPTLHQKAAETLSHLEAAHQQIARLSGSLFGDGGNCQDAPRPSPESVESTLSRCSELVSMLVSRLGTLNRQVGSETPPAASNRDPRGISGPYRDAA